MEEMGYWVTDSLPSFAKNLHILVVDHDPFSLKHLASLLKQQSYNVSTAGLARGALSMIQEKGDWFDLVMANISMPDMDSFSFLHVFLKMNIAVIFMSSGMNLNIATKALAEGASYFLQKPISKDDLKYVWQHVYRRNNNKNIFNNNNYNYQLPMNSCYKDQKEKNTMINNNKQNLGGYDRLILDHEDDERRKKYFSNNNRSRVVWNSERRRKFTDALYKLGDQSRPKLILKLMNEPCLTLLQVTNHLQKYKAQVQCFKRRRENNLAYKREIPNNGGLMTSFIGGESIPNNGGLMRSVIGGERLRLIAPKSIVVNPKFPVSNNFVNHNFQQFGPNGYNYKEEGCGFQTSSQFNKFPNATDQELDYNYLSGLKIDRKQKHGQEQEGIIELLPAKATSSENEGKQLTLTEYGYLLNQIELEVLDNNDSYNDLVNDDLNLSEVDKYSEWLRKTLFENQTDSENFPPGNTQRNHVEVRDEYQMIGSY